MKSLVSALAAVAAIGLHAATTYTATEQYVKNVVAAESNRTDLAIGALRQEVQDAKYLTPSAIKAGANVSVTTNAAGEVTIAADGGVEADFTTNNTVLVTTIETVAPAPSDYATVSNAAMNAAITNAMQSAAIAERPTKAQLDAGWWSEWNQSPSGPYHWQVDYNDGKWTLYNAAFGPSPLGTRCTDENATSFESRRVEDVVYTFTRHRVAAPVPTKPEDIGAASTNDVHLSPVYSQTPTFSEWTILRDGVDVTSQIQQPVYGFDGSEESWYWQVFCVDGDDPGVDQFEEPLDITGLSWSDNDDENHYTATRTRTDIIGYTLGDQTDKPLASADSLLFAQYYPDGSVKSAAEFTAGIIYNAPDTTHRTITVKPFCNTNIAMNDNSSLVGRVVIPPFVDASGNGYISDDGRRYKVVGVSGDGADEDNSNLTAIVAPNTVTNIGAWAFSACSALTSVSLHAATIIEEHAFSDCYRMSTISLPAATSIGDGAFYRCPSLTSVDFGDTPRSSVPSLGNDAFYGVLTSCKIIVPDAQYDAWIAATLPDESSNPWYALVTAGYKFLRHSEWEYARRYETTLTPVYSQTPTFSEWICVPAEYAEDPNYIKWEDGAWQCYNGAVRVEEGTVTDFNATIVSCNLFTATRTRTDILGYTLGSQSDKVLATTNAVGLTIDQKVIPDSPQAVAGGAVYTSITNIEKQMTRVSGYPSIRGESTFVFEDGKIATIYCLYISSNIIAQAREQSGTEAKLRVAYGGYDCRNDIEAQTFESSFLQSIEAPNIATIETNSFRWSRDLEKADFPSVKNVGAEAFWYCTSLKSQDLPMTTNIGEFAFGECSALERIYLPTIQTIGNQAFKNDISLREVNFGNEKREGAEIPSIGADVFLGVSTNCVIVVPNAVYEDWKNAPGWTNMVLQGYQFVKYTEWQPARKFEVPTFQSVQSLIKEAIDEADTSYHRYESGQPLPVFLNQSVQYVTNVTSSTLAIYLPEGQQKTKDWIIYLHCNTDLEIKLPRGKWWWYQNSSLLQIPRITPAVLYFSQIGENEFFFHRKFVERVFVPEGD